MSVVSGLPIGKASQSQVETCCCKNTSIVCIDQNVEVKELLLLHSSLPGHGDGQGEQQHDEEEGHEPECPGDDVDLGLEVDGAALQVNGMIIVIANKRKNYLHLRHTFCHGTE